MYGRTGEPGYFGEKGQGLSLNNVHAAGSLPNLAETGFESATPRSTRPVAGQRNRQPKPAPRGHSRCKPGSTAGARQPGSTANPATLRSSRLNSTPIRWIG